MESTTKYLADALSFLRAVATVPLVVFSIIGDWHAAFLILIAAWATDLIDGVIAKKYGSFCTDHKIDADGIADSVLAFGSTAVPLLYAWHHNLVAGVLVSILYVATMAFGLWMVLVMDKPLTPRHRWVIAGNMIVMHSIVQIGATLLWFDYMASGATMALRLSFLLLLVVALENRKIRLWWSGRLR